MNIKSVVRFLVFLTLILTLPIIAFARIGVGVGVGKIHVDNQLKAGGVYDLPSIPVLNTGDKPTNYQFSVQYHEGQETNPDMGLRPAEDWFNFTPRHSFYLEPDEVQVMEITLTLPTTIKPGNYFAYLEARPVIKTASGETSVEIAAATQLWFTVVPTNFLHGVYYRFVSLYSRYHPWNTVVLMMFFVTTLLWIVSKKFKFQIIKK